MTTTQATTKTHDQAETAVTGWVLRANIEEGSARSFERAYGASDLGWASNDLEGAWVHPSLPRPDNWFVEPVEYAQAQYVKGDGVRRIGPWIPWRKS
jgi:hypothetical protein